MAQFSLREIDIATGKVESTQTEDLPSLSVIDGAFTECELETLERTRNATQQAHENIQQLEQQLTEKVGVANATDLSPLAGTLKEILDVLNDRLARRGVAETTAKVDHVDAENTTTETATS